MIGTTLRNFLCIIGMVTLVAYAAMAGLMGSPALDATAVAQTQGQVPGNALGNINDAEFWRQVRHGISGTVSIPDKMAGVLVQSEGDSWRVFRNGPLANFGGWLLLAVVVVLAVFFAVRGRIRIDRGYIFFIFVSNFRCLTLACRSRPGIATCGSQFLSDAHFT